MRRSTVGQLSALRGDLCWSQNALRIASWNPSYSSAGPLSKSKENMAFQHKNTTFSVQMQECAQVQRRSPARCRSCPDRAACCHCGNRNRCTSPAQQCTGQPNLDTCPRHESCRSSHFFPLRTSMMSPELSMKVGHESSSVASSSSLASPLQNSIRKVTLKCTLNVHYM